MRAWIPQMRAKQADSDPRLQCVFLGKTRVLGLPDRIYPLFVSRFVSTSLGFSPSGTFHTVAVRQG